MDAFFTLCIHVVNNSYDVLEVIVAEVQAHPILWNRNTQDYKRSDKKKIVWNAIAQKVGLEGKICILNHDPIIVNLKPFQLFFKKPTVTFYSKLCKHFPKKFTLLSSGGVISHDYHI